MQVSINLPPKLLSDIDGVAIAKSVSRSAFIVECVERSLTEDTYMDTRAELLERENLQLKEDIGYLRGEYSKINDALAQRLIAESAEEIQEAKLTRWKRFTAWFAGNPR